jgi:hypothetical protein
MTRDIGPYPSGVRESRRSLRGFASYDLIDAAPFRVRRSWSTVMLRQSNVECIARAIHPTPGTGTFRPGSTKVGAAFPFAARKFRPGSGKAVAERRTTGPAADPEPGAQVQ